MNAPVFAHGHLRLYLLSLLDEQPRHGYELIQALSDRFDGTYAPSAGTIYPRLAKLEAEGLVTKETDGRKTIYRITPAGHQEVVDRADELVEIEKDVDSSVQRLARQVREGLSSARNQMRAEFEGFARDAREAAVPGSDRAGEYADKAGEYAQWAADKADEYGHRASDGAKAGWSAASEARRGGADFFEQTSAGFRAGFRATAGQSEGSTDTDATADADSTADAGTTGSSAGGASEPTGAGTASSAGPRRFTDVPHPEPGPSPEPPAGDAGTPGPGPDASIGQRIDFVVGTFRNDIRQDVRSADRRGALSPEIVSLVDAELGRVRDLVRHALSMRD